VTALITLTEGQRKLCITTACQKGEAIQDL